MHPIAVRNAIRGSADPAVADRVFDSVNRAMMRRVLAVAEHFAPDLIVHEPFAAAAAIAAELLKTPAVLHNVGLDHGERVCTRLAGGRGRGGWLTAPCERPRISRPAAAACRSRRTGSPPPTSPA
ncbi:hypothetical protein NSK11_contig00015-0078 [Nocardia seriolae]|uniref:Erythromycin biosynthesis protein CIII-like N-terminal domain-containing protein n=2 Tax=Nocardia seriolae TaxID=37332 RepID=A0ABC9YPC7_9NOCA|nr:glycosyltransferase [Nocardia seriolae]GAP27237.1 hypothetical protein NSK11_contig00015-0078 [Nocardia seriolae]